MSFVPASDKEEHHTAASRGFISDSYVRDAMLQMCFDGSDETHTRVHEDVQQCLDQCTDAVTLHLTMFYYPTTQTKTQPQLKVLDTVCTTMSKLHSELLDKILVTTSVGTISDIDENGANESNPDLDICVRNISTVNRAMHRVTLQLLFATTTASITNTTISSNMAIDHNDDHDPISWKYVTTKRTFHLS